MLKSGNSYIFLLLICLSISLHAAFLRFIEPTLKADLSRTVLYSWGEINNAETLLAVSRQGGSSAYHENYRRFILPLERMIIPSPKKGSPLFTSLKSLPKSIFSSKTTGDLLPYLFKAGPVQAKDLTLMPGFIKDRDLENKYFSRKKLSIEFLISPSGRVVWTKKPVLLYNIGNCFDFDDWAQGLVFPSGRTYYWKSIVYMVQ